MLGSPISKSCQLPYKFCWALSEATSPVTVTAALVGVWSHQRFPGWLLSFQAVHSHQVACGDSGSTTGHYAN